MNNGRRMANWVLAVAVVMSLVSPLAQPQVTSASSPSSGTLNPPTSGSGTVVLTWTGGPYTSANPSPQTGSPICDPGDTLCDNYTFTWNAPANYWDTHQGNVKVQVSWPNSANDFDVYVFDSNGREVNSSPTGNDPEVVELHQLAPGTYTVKIVAFLAQAETYTGTVTLVTTEVPPAMVYPENKDTVMNLLTVDYPINVVMVGYHPTAQEVADLKRFVPQRYKPTIGNLSPGGDEVQNSGAGELNWNKNHLLDSVPYFLGVKYNYVVHIIQASDDYARALFDVARANTAQAQAFHSSTRGANLARYDATFGRYRVLAKGGDAAYAVTDPTKTDLIDAYAVEDWMFNTRYDARWNCAFRDAETNSCYNPSVIQPDPTAYYDPYYDRNGLNLDRMPQGLNKGSSFFFLDTFTPSYASTYFRPNAYHTYGTDRVVNGTIDPRPVEQGGSWRITDPSSHAWKGVDFSRTWGGRYRFHFIDLGAAPNDYESASWAGAERQLSSDYPHGDPPIWQYLADPLWRQTSDSCLADNQTTSYTGNTPCRMMPRLGRDVAYGLFFRSTAGYLYRPIPRGDVNWLAVSNWTEFYSRPQWVNGALTNAPWYGTWWTNTDVLYQINQAGDNNNDVLRWLSSALPYTRWVGRKNETIPIYDPTSNQPTGRTLDTSPKYADLPAPKYHVQQGTTGINLVREPLYPGDGHDVIVQYGTSQVNLTKVSNTVEKAKAMGIGAGTYDASVNTNVMRNFVDANRAGIADIVSVNGFQALNTIPSIDMVFEKANTWALPAIAGGVAIEDADGNSWGVLNNVNDRFRWSGSHYPGVQPSDQPGTPRSMTNASTPTQDSGTGFSYTIEHEAAHNLGLSHPHDGSYGVDRCPDTDPDPAKRGQWECYWSGLGWMYDLSAAPTTYAMAYRPYEVEDQDNLQRGRLAEYLISGQKALTDRLVAEAQAGRTTPSPEWTADFERMKTWRAQAAQLFRNGDYLHGEYAARNGAFAARGFPQTAANTSDPRLVEAGQLYYFNVHPQSDGTPPRPDLIISNIQATAVRPGQTTLTASVTNLGAGPASNVVVRFLDGQTAIADSAALAALASGATSQVSVSWNTRALNGEHTIVAVADPANTVAETNETNNQATRIVTIKGNKVTNGSFEQSSGTAPAGWTGSQGTSYDTSGTNSSDGTRSASATGNGGPASLLNPTWTSSPVAVTAGQTYDLAVSVKTLGASSAPSLKVQYLDALGNILNTVTGISTTVTGNSAMQQVLGQVTIPQGVTQVRLTLLAFSPTDLTTRGSVWFDDVWLTER